MKRAFDILTSVMALVLLSPVLIAIAISIVLDSRGGVFFQQLRIGKNQETFKILKFRTMKPNSEKHGQLTVGERDPRVTKAGYFLRKYKLDELPQLLNILKGDMSIVGPRPEVPAYLPYYSDPDLAIFSVRPGLTDYASVEYVNEDVELNNAENPEAYYIQHILPKKLNLQRRYVTEHTFGKDLQIIGATIRAILR